MKNERLDNIEKKLEVIENLVKRLDDGFESTFSTDEFDIFLFNDGEASWWETTSKINKIEKFIDDLSQNTKVIDMIKISQYEERINELENIIRIKEEEITNKALNERGIQEWQKIVDEMAHSINTDVFAALSNLNEITDSNEVNKAKHNIKRIRDIANLMMWDLNKTRLPASTTISTIDLYQLIQTQIDAIKDGIDSLRLSIREHKSKLYQLVIPFTVKNECIIQIDDNIEPGLELIIKDLLRNAFQNTDEENPLISIEIFSADDFIYLIITNNRIISKKELQWFNEDIDDDEIQMSKSSKVGLRLVKRWFKNLSITGNFLIDSKLNQTSIKLQIPKVIRYEKI